VWIKFALTPCNINFYGIFEMKHFSANQRTAIFLATVLLSALTAGCGGGGDPTATPTALLLRSTAVLAVPAPVNLGAAGTFAILSKSGVTDVAPSAITGDVGSSPITGAAILVSCSEVTGTIYSVDAAGPAPCVVTNAALLTTAVGDMQAAYTDVAGRTMPDFVNLGAGEVGGLTLTPGLYSWSTGVLISSNVTLNGGPNDVWIFQVAGTLTQASATQVTLTGGAVASNVIWQVAGATTIGTTAHFEGTLLDQTSIAVNTGASVTGRLLAQTAVTLQQNVVTLAGGTGSGTGTGTGTPPSDDNHDKHGDSESESSHHNEHKHGEKPSPSHQNDRS
jgi:hypothetical protein